MAIGLPVKILFVGSLAFNALVIGTIVAGSMRGLHIVGPGRGVESGSRFGSAEALRRATPEQKAMLATARTELRDAMRAHRSKFRDVRYARLELQKSLLNPAATSGDIAKLLGSVRTSSAEVQALTDAALSDILVRVKPEERAALLAFLGGRGLAVGESRPPRDGLRDRPGAADHHKTPPSALRDGPPLPP